MADPRDQVELLRQAAEHARRVEEELLRHQAELAKDASLEPGVREEGLRVVRAAASAAHQLFLNAHSALRVNHIRLDSATAEHEASS